MQQPLSPLSCWVWGHHHISTSLLSPFVSLPLSPRDTFQPPASWTVGFWCPLNQFLVLHDAPLPGFLTSLGLHSILHNHSFQQPPDGRSAPQTFTMDAPDTASKRTPPLCAARVLVNSSYLHHHSIIMPDSSLFLIPHSASPLKLAPHFWEHLKFDLFLLPYLWSYLIWASTTMFPFSVPE